MDIANSFIKSLKHKKEKKISTKTGGGLRSFMSKLSSAFLLPISVLAIAGLFLGIGATISGNSPSGSAGQKFGEFIKQLGDPLFGALPLLFAAAITVSFTEEAGIAVFNSIIGYLIFSSIQSVFIDPIVEKTEYTGPNDDKKLFEKIIGYKILYSGFWRNPKDLKSLVGTTLGISSLQTSVFGGIIVGFIVQWAYKTFHTIQLPQVISFFGGKRFVALSVIFFMIPLAFLFLILWPYIGYIFNWIGKNSGKIPYGFDSFIFGFIERSLVPFGLHHVFYSPLWYTSAGGDVSSELLNWLETNQIRAYDFDQIIKALQGKPGIDINSNNLNNFIGKSNLVNFENGSVQGDSATSLALLGVNINKVTFKKSDGIIQSLPLFEFIQNELGLKIGRFLDGKFSFMQWGLPFAGAAMIMAAPKENRKIALGTVLPSSLTCFITGVTEPLEFTFLFLAPILFFGFHAFMCATSFLLANLLSVHVGMAFSGGFLDLLIYGMLPILKGTNFYWTIVVGAGYAPIYFLVFYFWIKKADLATPGRGGNVKLFTKKDYLESKDSIDKSNKDSKSNEAFSIIEAFGGRNNISKTANCASRLRFDVKDMNLVNENKLKSLGAFGIRKTSDTHIQVIFGPRADQLRVKIDEVIKEIDNNPSIIKEFSNVAPSESTNSEHNFVKDIKVYSPTHSIKSLESLNDGVFSQKMVGVGFAMELSSDGNVYAPISGKLTTVFPTKHAYGIENEDGLSILVHIGIDTVSLNGKGFISHVEQGQEIKQGEILATVDKKVLDENKLISDVICVVTTDSKIQPNDIRIQLNKDF